MKKFEMSISDADNCFCNICHSPMQVLKLKYYTKDYGSNNRKGKICKTLQKHPHEIWICNKCLGDLVGEWYKTQTECARKGFKIKW